MNIFLILCCCLVHLTVLAQSYENFVSSKRWKLVWSDEFNSGETTSCYTRPAKCLMEPNTIPVDCPPAVNEQLRNLNKCVWSVYSFYNYMDQGKGPSNPGVSSSQKKGINVFDPSMVSVRDGTLILSAKKASTTDFNCGQELGGGSKGKGCPFISGGIESQGFLNSVEGKFFKFGRFEVRAKLPSGRGSWPAHWMLPQQSSNPLVPNWWPQAGEIDLMENWANWENAPAQTLHGKKNDTNLSKTFRLQKKSRYFNSFQTEYHVFAAEWSDSEINFYIDNRHVGKIKDKDNVSSVGGNLPLSIPKDHAFFWILNSTIAHHCYANSKFQPIPRLCDSRLVNLPKTLSLKDIPSDFVTQTHYIDYVRYYAACSDDDSSDKCQESTLNYQCSHPCNGMGQFDGYNCYLGSAGAGKRAHKYQDNFYTSENGVLSFWGNVPQGRGAFVTGEKFYLTPVCSPTKNLPNCSNPCPDGGTYDGKNCHLLSLPSQYKFFILNKGLYYLKPGLNKKNTCPYSGPNQVTSVGVNCFLNYTLPPNSRAFISNSNLYLKAACTNTTDWVSLQGTDADIRE